MGKPILERIRRPSYWYKDQLPHLLLGFSCNASPSCALAYGADFNVIGSIVVGLLVSGVIGHGRELVQNWGDAPEVGNQEDMGIDLSAWNLGNNLAPLAVLGAL